MRMMKSLLLGSAAGLVAVAGAQAADLPVKAKPVEYVKICNLYGDGFFYIPGTDTCLRLGANIQADMYWNSLGGGHILYDQAGGAQDRSTSHLGTKARGDFAIDSRTQTMYGTLRTYQVFRIDNVDQGTVTPNLVRNFVQWAGFTFGHTKSYSDPIGTFNDFKASFQEGALFHSTGANGTNQIAYTWELGNGMVVVVGADERKNSPLVNLSNAGSVTLGGTPTTSRGGQDFWDPYAAFRMSQAWGGFTASVHANNNNALYYTANVPGSPNQQCLGQAGAPAPVQAGGTTLCDHPADKMGFAFDAGIEIKLPWIAAGDRVGAVFGYGVGATRYVLANTVAAGLYGGGNTIATGVSSDAVYVNGSAMQLTTAWAVGASFEHWWTPEVSSIIYGGTGQIQYNSTVVNSRWFCGGGGAAAQTYTIAGGAACDPGFRLTQVGAQVDWYPIRGLRFSWGVLHDFFDSGFGGQTITIAKTQGLRPVGVYTTQDKGTTAGVFRVQRFFGGPGEG
jgi:hypothetical protein